MRRTPAAVTLALALAAAPVLPAAAPAAAAAPTATVVVEKTGLAIGDTSLVTITFSEPVLDFTAADMTVSLGTLSAVSTSDDQVFTAVLTPQAGVTAYGLRLVLDNTGVTDVDGTPGSGTTQSNDFSVDTVRPTATVAVSRAALRDGDTATVTLTFSEAVTGLTSADLTVGAGSASTPSAATAGSPGSRRSPPWPAPRPAVRWWRWTWPASRTSRATPARAPRPPRPTTSTPSGRPWPPST